MATEKAPTPSQPTSTPPGGGSWTWDGINNQWVPRDVQASTTNTEQE